MTSDIGRRRNNQTTWQGARMQDRQSDIILLIGRVLLTTVFFQSLYHHLTDFTAWIANLRGWGVPAPDVAAYLSEVVIVAIVVLLITGWWPKIAVALFLSFLVVATYYGHQFWKFDGPMRAIQYANFTKNFSLAGGILLYLVTGPGKFILGRPPAR